MSRIDPASNKVIATIDVDDPWAVAAQPDAIWVTNAASDTVSRIRR